MTKIADVPPSACAACFGQYTDRRHVDFEAAWDGPVLDGSVKVAIDDLVICENCLRDGFNVLQFEAEAERITALEVEREQMQAHIREQGEHIQKLEAAMATRPPTFTITGAVPFVYPKVQAVASRPTTTEPMEQRAGTVPSQPSASAAVAPKPRRRRQPQRKP